MSKELNEMFESQTSTTLPEGAVVLEQKETETPAIPKAEIPEKTETPKAEEPKEIPKTLFDNFKKAETKEPEKTPEPPKPSFESKKEQALPPDVIAKLERLEQIEKSKAVKLLAGNYDLSDKDLHEWLKEAVGVDYSTMSAEQLIAKDIESKYPNLNNEKRQALIVETMEEFQGLSEAKQSAELSRISDTLSKAQTESDLFKDLKEIQENQKKIEDPDKWYEEKVTNDFMQKYEEVKTTIGELGKQLVGQKYGSYTVTEEDATNMVSEYENQTKEFNPEKLGFNLYKIATYDAFGKSEYERGKLEATKGQANPNTNSNNGPVIVPKTEESGMKGAKSEDFFEQANN